ncbi:MAG: response regulator transcription factor [Rhodobacteraceae bacterium]|nr:response regulator transcription factor [Paracoccaceae bacterium]
MKILLMDDHQLIRDVMKQYLEDNLDIEVASASTQEEAMRAISDIGRFACVLADLRVPDARGAKSLGLIVQANSPSPVILFSGAARYADLFEAEGAGMAGYIRKDMHAHEVADLVQSIVANPNDIPEEISFAHQTKLARQAPRNMPNRLPDCLTEDDCVMLAMLAQGARNTEIASRMGLNRTRVENKLRAIYKSLGVSTRLAAATFYNDLAA